MFPPFSSTVNGVSYGTRTNKTGADAAPVKGDCHSMQETENPRSLRERAAALFHGKGGESAVPGRRRGKRIAAAAVILVVLAAAILPRLGNSGGENVVSPLDVMTLSPTDLQRTISATGTVESASSVLVYSTQSYAVQEVLVEVGDYVEEGQLMAKLDDGTILDQIESQEAALSASSSASSAAIAAAEHNYEQYKAALDAGLNSSILSAESSVSNAYDSYVTAYNTYERYRADLAAGTNSAILSAENALESAEDAYLSAQKTYERYSESLDEGENSTILAQESALRSAETALANAEDTYDAALDSLDNAESAYDTARTAANTAQDVVNQKAQTLQTAEKECADLEAQVSAGTATQTQLDAAEAKRDDAQREFDTAQTAKSEADAALTTARTALDTAESQASAAQRALENAEAAYDTAQAQYRAALTSADNALEDYADAIDTAYKAYLDAQVTLESAQQDAQETLSDYADRLNAAYETYQTALESLESTENAAQNQLQSYQDNLNSAYANANTGTSEVSLRQLRADLEGTEITAPAAGTVTAVYAEVGSSGAGLLFVIEDVENLVVATSVKDYDVASVSTGMAVAIQSDSTGDSVYDGEVTSIAPTANKNAAGETDTSGDISFATDVAVTSRDTGLRIGMSVELDFVLDEAMNALSVPYDAVYTNGQGQTCLLVLEEGEDGELLLTELPVTTGLETDLDIAVEGDGLSEGTQVVTDPDRYLPLAGQEIILGTEGAA